MKILVTGAAGFIGSTLIRKLAERGDEVMGIDNINDYYDVELKYARLKECGFNQPFTDLESYASSRYPLLHFTKVDLCDEENIDRIFEVGQFDKVVNLAAQAGVRYSITHPRSYIGSNLNGFYNLLEACRNYHVKHLIFASSSSVYGLNTKVPFSEEDLTDAPVSLYAATKKSNELMAHSYAQLYGFAATGLRFFTVYGPWGRPDMAPFKFTRKISAGETIDVYNNGDMNRDFTYIDDIIEGTLKVIDSMPKRQLVKDGVEGPAFRVYNIGCGHPEKLMDFISELENTIGKPAKIHFMPMQPGDIYTTYADTTRLETEMGYKAKVGLREGIQKFVEWYQSDKNPLK